MNKLTTEQIEAVVKVFYDYTELTDANMIYVRTALESVGGKEEKPKCTDAHEIVNNVSGSVCPKCGCTDYEEWEELEYENGGDDPIYGGALVPMKFTRCGECD